ncbi:hypothetical protein [Streptomyces chartreusis]|uniref:hypothetical protein n=1 Tax=Streptomyces chartreusis TaxID=1969 RepID=UPI0036342DCF
MGALIIERNRKSVPGGDTISEAMTLSGGTVTEIEGDSKAKRVRYTGTISTTVFENRLEDLVPGSDKHSWTISEMGDEMPADAYAGGGSLYEVAINIPRKTVETLGENDYNLYGFKAVVGDGKGSPVVWFKYGDYSSLTVVDWTEQYEAYTSKSKIIPGGTIVSSSSYPARLGQTLEVTGEQGTGDVVSGDAPGAIGIQSMVTGQFTCGIAQTVLGKTRTLCAFPLLPTFNVTIAPIQKVLLMFATGTVNTGTVLMNATSRCIMIDLTTANQREITFDLDKGGWVTGGASWAQVYPPKTDLVPLLVDRPSQVAGARGVGRSLIGTGTHALDS